MPTLDELQEVITTMAAQINVLVGMLDGDPLPPAVQEKVDAIFALVAALQALLEANLP